jgi:hypothetical protein
MLKSDLNQYQTRGIFGILSKLDNKALGFKLLKLK